MIKVKRVYIKNAWDILFWNLLISFLIGLAQGSTFIEIKNTCYTGVMIFLLSLLFIKIKVEVEELE